MKMEFKCVMSLEKAIVLKKYPTLILQYLKNKHQKDINVLNIYYTRNNKNLKMKNVIFYIEYSLI